MELSRNGQRGLSDDDHAVYHTMRLQLDRLKRENATLLAAAGISRNADPPPPPPLERLAERVKVIGGADPDPLVLIKVHAGTVELHIDELHRPDAWHVVYLSVPVLAALIRAEMCNRFIANPTVLALLDTIDRDAAK